MTIEAFPLSLDPSFEVTPTENQWAQAEEEARTASDYVKVGVLLGAGFMVWRHLVKSDMPTLAEPNNITILEALQPVLKRVTPMWLKATVPALERAYEIGSHAALDTEEITFLATIYAKEMEDYASETSTKALLEGFNALVNKRWSPQVAYRRALEGFGLTSDGMKTYITSMENLNTDYLPSALTDDPRVNGVLTKLLGQRSLSIGENEAYTAQEMGRQIMWMRAAEEGLISKDSRRLWRTAKDERVCPTCAPMNEEVVGLYDKFDVQGNEYWNPVLHPNCRCWVELIEPEGVGKAYNPQEHPRGGNARNKGQFSRGWGSRAQVKEADSDPIVDQIIADALKATTVTDNKVKTFEENTFKTFEENTFKTFSTKSFNALKTPEAFKQASTFKTFTSRPFKVQPGLNFQEAMVYHYKTRTPLWVEPEGVETVGPSVFVSGLYAFEYQSEDYKRGQTVNGRSISHPFVDNLEMSVEMANDYAETIKGSIYYAMNHSPVLKRRFNTYLEDEIKTAISDMDNDKIERLAVEIGETSIDVYEHRDGLIQELTDFLMEPQLEKVDPTHDIAAQTLLEENPELMQAQDEALHQVMVDLLENYDPATTEAARHLIPTVFPQGVPYDEGGTTVRALIPTIYLVEEPTETNVLDAPDVDMDFARSRPYVLDGEYVVDHVSYDENPTTFHQVQMVYLIKNEISKSFDPFGVLHLGVK